MPTFDFVCKKCGQAFEKLLPLGSSKKPDCPQCGSRSVEKKITPPGIIFKGGGFYKTDSRPAKKTEGTAPAKQADGPKSAKPGEAKSS